MTSADRQNGKLAGVGMDGGSVLAALLVAAMGAMLLYCIFPAFTLEIVRALIDLTR